MVAALVVAAVWLQGAAQGSAAPLPDYVPQAVASVVDADAGRDTGPLTTTGPTGPANTSPAPVVLVMLGAALVGIAVFSRYRESGAQR